MTVSLSTYLPSVSVSVPAGPALSATADMLAATADMLAAAAAPPPPPAMTTMASPPPSTAPSNDQALAALLVSKFVQPALDDLLHPQLHLALPAASSRSLALDKAATQIAHVGILVKYAAGSYLLDAIGAALLDAACQYNAGGNMMAPVYAQLAARISQKLAALAGGRAPTQGKEERYEEEQRDSDGYNGYILGPFAFNAALRRVCEWVAASLPTKVGAEEGEGKVGKVGSGGGGGEGRAWCKKRSILALCFIGELYNAGVVDAIKIRVTLLPMLKSPPLLEDLLEGSINLLNVIGPRMDLSPHDSDRGCFQECLAEVKHKVVNGSVHRSVILMMMVRVCGDDGVLLESLVRHFLTIDCRA